MLASRVRAVLVGAVALGAGPAPAHIVVHPERSERRALLDPLSATLLEVELKAKVPPEPAAPGHR